MIFLNLKMHSNKPTVRCSRSCDRQHPVGVVSSARCRRERFAVLLVKFDRLLDNLAEFGKHRLFVVAVAPARQQTWTASDVTLIFIRPFDNLDETGAVFHCCDSLIAARTAFSW